MRIVRSRLADGVLMQLDSHGSRAPLRPSGLLTLAGLPAPLSFLANCCAAATAARSQIESTLLGAVALASGGGRRHSRCRIADHITPARVRDPGYASRLLAHLCRLSPFTVFAQVSRIRKAAVRATRWQQSPGRCPFRLTWFFID